MKKQLLPLTETSILVALAIVLELMKKYLPFVSLLHFPDGGTIWITMLPLIIIGLRHGLSWGLLGCLIFAPLNFAIDGGKIYGIGTIPFDYILAYTVLGFSGLFKPYKLHNYLLAFVFVGTLSLLMHTIAGVIDFKVSFVASLIYNLSYVGPSTVICMILAYVLRPIVLKKNFI